MARHVRKGDTVIVNSGDHKGSVGEILSVDPSNNSVVVKGVNLKTKHVRPTRQGQVGGIIQKEMPLHMSNVNPVIDGKASRVRFIIKPDGSKTRVAVKGGKELGVVSPAKK
jgi:large subunit ribosomal protein L24